MKTIARTVCYAIKRTDVCNTYLNAMCQWSLGLCSAFMYDDQDIAQSMADRRGCPCKVVTVILREVER